MLYILKQYQGISGNWDDNSNAAISTIPFAGATPGNKDFADYFNSLLGDVCDRIHNKNDIVPHAWETNDLKELPDLYKSKNIEFPWKLKEALKGVELTIKGYEQIKTSNQFSFSLSDEYKDYMDQAVYQHIKSYPKVLKVDALLSFN